MLKTTAIQHGAFLPEHNKELPSGLEPRPELEVKQGDLLITCAGPRSRCGVPCLVRVTRPHLMISGKMYRMRADERLASPEFIEAFLRAPDTQQRIERMKTGISDSGLNLTHARFTQLEMPLPPLPEQRRIVARIEELQERTRRAREALEAIPPLLERFRQSVLAAAFRGDLTADWRVKNPEVEPASVLLERIRAGRRRQWEEAELAKLRAKGKEPKDDRWKQKYQEPEPVDAEGLPELPEGYAWASVEAITENFDGARVPLKRADRSKRPGPYLYFGASGAIDTIDDYLFDGAFLLVAEDGANLLSRRTPIAFQAHGRFWVNNHAHVLQSVGGIQLGYLEHCLNGIDLQQWVTGTAQPKLTQKALNSVPIPLAPLSEQEEILRLVPAALAKADAIAEATAATSGALEMVNASILSKAFCGELVPQDPNDEPAGVLLERLRRERSGAQPKRGRRARA